MGKSQNDYPDGPYEIWERECVAIASKLPLVNGVSAEEIGRLIFEVLEPPEVESSSMPEGRYRTPAERRRMFRDLIRSAKSLVQAINQAKEFADSGYGEMAAVIGKQWDTGKCEFSERRTPTYYKEMGRGAEKISRIKNEIEKLTEYATLTLEKSHIFRGKRGPSTEIHNYIFQLRPIYEQATGKRFGRTTYKGDRGQSFVIDVLKAMGVEAKPSTVQAGIDAVVAEFRAFEREWMRERNKKG